MPIRYVAKMVKGFFIYRVLHVDDTPHRIALGVAVGIFVTWTPTIGFQMILTLMLASLLRANKFVGIPFVWISNPLTAPMIYWPNFELGHRLLGGNYHRPDFMKAFQANGSGMLEVWVNRVRSFWEATWHAFAPLWLGSIVVGLVLGVLSYVAVHYAVVAYRKHRHHLEMETKNPTQEA